MKKILISLVLVGLLLVPSIGYAQTKADDNRVLIEALLKYIALLTEQVRLLQSKMIAQEINSFDTSEELKVIKEKDPHEQFLVRRWVFLLTTSGEWVWDMYKPIPSGLTTFKVYNRCIHQYTKGKDWIASDIIPCDERFETRPVNDVTVSVNEETKQTDENGVVSFNVDKGRIKVCEVGIEKKCNLDLIVE